MLEQQNNDEEIAMEDTLKVTMDDDVMTADPISNKPLDVDNNDIVLNTIGIIQESTN